MDYGGDVVATVRERHPEGVDAMIDLVNRDAGALSQVAALVKEGGRVATTMGSADVDDLAALGVAATNVVAQADPAPFARLVEVAGDGSLTISVTRTFSLGDIDEGLELLGSGRHGASTS